MTAPAVTPSPAVTLVDKQRPVGIYAQVPARTPGGEPIRATVGFAVPVQHGWRVRIIAGRHAGLDVQTETAQGARDVLTAHTGGAL